MEKHRATVNFCLYDTAFGVAALAWTTQGICGHQLPEQNASATEDKVREKFPNAISSKPPEEIVMLTRRLRKHLEGNVQDFSNVRLDLAGLPPFHSKVYLALQKVALGNTVSYGELAQMAGSPDAAQAVGQAMAKNPISVIVPCHRVLTSVGTMGGFTAYGGVETKQQLLKNESALPPVKVPVMIS